MGSGGGLPGIPLAIARPGLQVVSVDSVGKKINFQKHLKRTGNIANLQPIAARMETLNDSLAVDQRFDLAVSRAFSGFAQMLKLAAPWVQEGGELWAMKGPEAESELGEIEAQLPSFGFVLGAIANYRLPFSRAERRLVRFTRISHP
jgi:16S rRNA (guanine527-N7)-methyltransferase